MRAERAHDWQVCGYAWEGMRAERAKDMQGRACEQSEQRIIIYYTSDIHIYIYVYMNIYIYIYVCIYVYIYVCLLPIAEDLAA